MELTDLDLHDVFQRMNRFGDMLKTNRDIEKLVDAAKYDVPIIKQLQEQLILLTMLQESPQKDQIVRRALDYLLLMLALREIEQEPALKAERREWAASN